MKIFNNLPKLSSEDTANSIVTYESMDNADVTSWTDVDVIESGEKHHSLFKKISTMFKNIRYLFKTLGTTDISAIGDGTVTGGLSKINNDLFKTKDYTISLPSLTWLGEGSQLRWHYKNISELNATKVLSVSIVTWVSWSNTDYINVGIGDHTPESIMLISNVTSFRDNNANITVRVHYV